MPANREALQVTDAYRVHMTQLRARATAIAGRSWAAVTLDDLPGSHAAWLEANTAVVQAAKEAAALLSLGYVAAFLTLSTGKRHPTPTVPADPDRSAQHGRTVRDALASSIIAVRVALAHKRPAHQALQAGLVRAQYATALEVTTTGRTVLSEAFQQEDRIVGWRRVAGGGACGACLGAATGAIRSDDEVPEAHTFCVPAGTLVSGPRVANATRRRYEGEVIRVGCASGNLLTITPNHPVLTDAGWVAAGLLQEGDRVLSGGDRERASAPVVPDEQQMPALIEQVWRALRVAGCARVPTAAQDFHGDGMQSEVDVVTADGLLLDRQFSEVAQPFREPVLGFGYVAQSVLARQRGAVHGRFGAGTTSHRCVGCGRELATFGGSHSRHTQAVGVAAVPYVDPGLYEALSDDVSPDAEPFGDRSLGFTRDVGINGTSRNLQAGCPRFDPASEQGAAQGGDAYTRLGRRLAERLTGKVERDAVVDLRRVGFRGHVYNLQTAEGWYAADGVIVSNCRCVAEPVVAGVRERVRRPTGEDLFNDLTAEQQNQLFAGRGGKDKAELIRSGRVALADLVAPAPMVAVADGITERPLADLMR